MLDLRFQVGACSFSSSGSELFDPTERPSNGAVERVAAEDAEGNRDDRPDCPEEVLNAGGDIGGDVFGDADQTERTRDEEPEGGEE